MPWARPIKGAWVLEFRVQPGARRTEVVGPLGPSMKIRVRARADGGRANAELLQFLAEELGTTRAHIKIVRGSSSRTKLVLVDAEVDPAVLRSWADG